MKYALFATLLTFILCTNLYGNNTNEIVIPCAAIAVNSQTDIDNLVLTGCTSINGNLEIISTDPGDPITDLSKFSAITSISGHLLIADNPELVSLSGLNQLVQVDSNLVISNNAKLENLDIFTSLQRIGQDFQITTNNALKGNSTLPLLSHIGKA